MRIFKKKIWYNIFYIGWYLDPLDKDIGVASENELLEPILEWSINRCSYIFIVFK